MIKDQIKLSEIIYGFSILVIAVVYFYSAQLGFLFSWQHSNVTTIWPPSAIGFISILIFGARIWPGIWLGAFLANAAYFFPNPSFNLFQVILYSTSIAVGNTLEALIACFFLKKLIGNRNPLHKVQDIARFMIVTVAGCVVSAFIGSVSVCMGSPIFWHSFLTVWLTWWLGDFTALITIVPIYWALSQRPLPKLNPKRLLEFFLSFGIFVMINGIFFDAKSIINQSHIHITYVPLALIVWLTYRFGYWGSIASTLAILYQDLQGTHSGIGPFISNDMNASLLSLQMFIGTVCGTSLLLAAALYERRRAQQEIIFREQRFKALVENSLDMIVLINPFGIISYSSPSTEKVMGYKKEEHEGHNIFEFIHPEDEPRISKEFSSILADSKLIITTVTRIRHKNASWRWIEGTGQNLLADPAIGAIVINYRDITERKAMEEVLKNELKQASRLADLGTLAAIVAHELRTPLGVIQMAAHNLMNKNKELVQDRHLENIQKKVWEGNRIIDNLLSYSRIKMPTYSNCQIVSLLEECLSNLKDQFRDTSVSIEKDYHIDPDFIIEADSDQIREILINVISNAYQAMKNKTGLIKISVEKQEEYLSIRIKDNGTGIDPDDLDKISNPFFTTKAKGTGLGLTICNELINLHHGRLDIQSVKDQGTTVSVILLIQHKIFE